MTTQCAVLDDDGLLTGFAPWPPDGEREPDAVEVPDPCDLEPFRYRFDRGAAAFIPLPPRRLLEASSPGYDGARAIALGFHRLQQAGLVTFDKETTDWVARVLGAADGG